MTETDLDRAIVEQAKGVLMLRYGVGSYESLAAMARWAREAHVPLPELANALVKGICQGRVTPGTQGMVRWLEHRLRGDIGEAPGAAGRVGRPHSTVARHAPVHVPRPTAVAAAGGDRQWRYTSAAHAARAVGNG
jgi:hypothetical protein